MATATAQSADPKKHGISWNRAIVAQWFLRGSGIEIGPLHQPLPIPSGAQVKYVDRLSRDDLRKQYPELNALPLVDPDVIDDGEKLNKFLPATQDFIIACHFLEHCADPIGALHTFQRVLKPGGILYLVIPDKLYTFDKDRPSTPFEHLVRDYEEGPEWSRDDHFLEWSEKVDKYTGEAARQRAESLKAIDYSIHYHVWTKPELLQALDVINQRYSLGFELQCFVNNGEEAIYVLNKPLSPGHPADIQQQAPSLSLRVLSRAAKRFGRGRW
jgi:SAM-dependent methyltransferase